MKLLNILENNEHKAGLLEKCFHYNNTHTHRCFTHWSRQGLSAVSCHCQQLCQKEQADYGGWLTSIFSASLFIHLSPDFFVITKWLWSAFLFSFVCLKSGRLYEDKVIKQSQELLFVESQSMYGYCKNKVGYGWKKKIQTKISWS